jgi:hypothetical protein
MNKMKDLSERIKDTAKKSAIEETKKEQAAARLRLAEVICHMLGDKQMIDVASIVSSPDVMANVLKDGLDATGLLLDDKKSAGTLRMNVELDMYLAPHNLDEELDRLATKYGTEYLAENIVGRHSRKEPHVGRHTAIFVEHVISDRLAMEAMAELKAAAPLEDQITGDPTLPEACVVDVLQRFLLAGEYFNTEIGASPTLELAIADAVAYIKELMDLRKVLAAQEDDGK